jgi:hypothetical protein
MDIEFKHLYCHIVQGTEVFEVEPTTGVVRVARPIDRESQSGISDNEIR